MILWFQNVYKFIVLHIYEFIPECIIITQWMRYHHMIFRFKWSWKIFNGMCLVYVGLRIQVEFLIKPHGLS